MLRNDLIILLSQGDNDPVTVDVNGSRLEVAAVKADRGGVVIVLDTGDLSTATHADPPTRPEPGASTRPEQAH